MSVETKKTKSVSLVSNPDEAKTRDRILDTALERFYQFGFSNVTVDEIAAELGMSKKTLYRHFRAKKELLRVGQERTVGRISEGLRRIGERSDWDSVTKLVAAWRFMVDNIPRPSQRFFQDLARNLPEVWRELDQRRSEVIRREFTGLFREGVRDGVFREDLGADFLILVFLALVQNVIKPETLSQLPLSGAQMFEKLTSILMTGVLTERGGRKYRAAIREEAGR